MKKENVMQTMGVLTQFRRCYEAIWPIAIQALFDFLWSRVPQLTNVHGGLQVLAFGLGLQGAWQAKALGVW